VQRKPDALLAVTRELGAQAGRLEHARQNRARDFVVLDDEHPIPAREG